MSRALFISDIHIQSAHDARAILLLRLLKACPNLGVTHLFLVGDIFDFWISDRQYFVRRYAEIIAAIQHLRTLQIEVHFFEGNHDLDLAPFWQAELGAEVHTEGTYFTIEGRVFRVEHGDQMDLEDRGYLFLRWFLRTPLLVWLGRILPNWIVRTIGERASKASRTYTSHVKVATDSTTRQVIEAHALRQFAQKPFDVLVSGHVHVEDDRTLTAGGQSFRSINLGTWLKEPLALDVSAHEIGLKKIEALLSLL